MQILSGKVPFLTKGPFALYFGGEEILDGLSNAKSGRALLYLYLISIIFNLVILGIEFDTEENIIFLILFLLGFKKYKARKISRHERLNEIVVGNFLNIFTVSAILLMAVFVAVGVSDHTRNVTTRNICTFSN